MTWQFIMKVPGLISLTSYLDLTGESQQRNGWGLGRESMPPVKRRLYSGQRQRKDLCMTLNFSPFGQADL